MTFGGAIEPVQNRAHTLTYGSLVGAVGAVERNPPISRGGAEDQVRHELTITDHAVPCCNWHIAPVGSVVQLLVELERRDPYADLD